MKSFAICNPWLNSGQNPSWMGLRYDGFSSSSSVVTVEADKICPLSIEWHHTGPKEIWPKNRITVYYLTQWPLRINRRTDGVVVGFADRQAIGLVVRSSTASRQMRWVSMELFYSRLDYKTMIIIKRNPLNEFCSDYLRHPHFIWAFCRCSLAHRCRKQQQMR